MIIKSLKLSNYRNYDSLEIDFDESINILYGNNAQGKTNILEAIYLSGTTRSHKGSKDKEIIKFGCEESHICVNVEKEERDFQIDIHLRKNKSKGIAVNKVPIKKASEVFGILNIVVFSPEDLAIIKAGPIERRKFMDSELCQLDKVYLYDLSIYNKALNQRNKLLKDINYNPSLKETLDVWDRQIIDYGKKVIERRRIFVKKLNEIIKTIHENITENKESLNIIYEENVSAEDYEREFFNSRDKDIRFGSTHIGPHRDDLCFEVNNVDMRKYGSQGQQRTCALSLKLAEIELVKETVKQKPVLLLDDVLSELDSDRQNLLLNQIEDIQTIITCTGVEDFIKNRFKINKIFQVENAKVTIKESL
ncbi:MAG: DNA replication/repair protein RecF [Eubacterium sp.]|nr:DNA replication/repair protein RecF [Eubacterium sp.]